MEAILGYVISAVVSSILGFLFSHLKVWQRLTAANKADENKNSVARKHLEEATTPEAIDESAKEIAIKF